MLQCQVMAMQGMTLPRTEGDRRWVKIEGGGE